MAENVDSLFMTLGLNLADLESGFVAADRTVRENIQRLNRENNLIRLRGEVQIAGLDETADAERILQIRQDALNQQMSIQRDRVRLLDAEFRRLAATHGTTNAAVQRAEVRLERERLALANLERESRRLNDTTGESNGIFDELSNMLPEIPTKFQAIGLAAGAVATGIGAASTTVQDLLEQFRELQNQSYELNMSFPDTKQFLRQVKLGGGDIGDIEGYIRGITDAYVKGEYDDPEFIALRKYGAQITDATGRLKEFKDITDEVYRAWEKADAAGEGIEFLQLTGGESGVRDIIQYFQRLKEAREDAAQIVNADIDTKQLHELDRAFGRLEEQSSELKAAIGDIFVPVAQAAADKLFDTVRDGTQFFVENKDAIQRWGFIVAETFSTVTDTIGDATSAIGDYLSEAVKLSQNKSTGDTRVDNTLENMSWRYGGQTAQSPWGNNPAPWTNFAEASQSYGALSGIIKRAEDNQRAFNGELEKSTTSWADFRREVEKTESKLKDKNPLNQYAQNRINEFRNELEDLRVELDFGDNKYLKSLAELDLWDEREGAYKNFLSDKERAILDEVKAARSELIKRDIDEAVDNDLRPANYGERLKLIEQETQKLIEAGMEQTEAYARAQDEINAKFKTSLEERIEGYLQDKEAWIKAGKDREEAEILTQQRIDKAREDYAKKAQDYYREAADIRFNASHTAFEKELRDIERWEEEQQKVIETDEQRTAVREAASAKIIASYDREVERVKKLTQSFEDKIFAQEHSQYEVDRRKLEQEIAQAYKDGVPRETLERYYKGELNKLNQRAGKGGDYTKAPTGANSGFQIVDYSQAQQQAIGLFTKENTARQSVINSLTAEQRARFEETGALDKIIAAQNSFATSTEKAADNLQDASSIEIISGDQMSGGATQSLDDILAEVTPKNELQQFGEQLKQVSESLPQQEIQDFSTATKDASDEQINFVDATKNSTEVTKNATDAHKNLSEMAIKARDSLDSLSEGVKKIDLDGAKKSGLRPDETAPREKVQLQTTPKDKSFLSVKDLGFDYDTAKDIFLTGVGLAATSASTGVGLAVSPEILAGSIIAALGGGVAKGTYDNRDERLNGAEKISLDDGALANIDLSEIVSPLSGIESNVQGIRDILQGNNAVKDANAEATPDTSENSSPDLLSPLNAINETAKSILGELQSRHDENDSIGELKSELSTQLSDAASQLSENLASPIQDIAQKLQDTQDNNVDDKISEISSTLSNDVAAKIQEVTQTLQARNADESAGVENEEVTRLDDIATKVQSIFDEMRAQQTAELETQPESPTESTDYLTPLSNIRDNVSGILNKLQETTQDTAQTVNLSEILSPITQNINAPLSDLRAAIDNKEFTLPEIKFPTEVIVQPLNTISQLVDQILKALSNREPPKIEISPNMDIDLGGAYVFDDNLKIALVNDITSNIVSKITEAVERATASISRSGGYGFGS